MPDIEEWEAGGDLDIPPVLRVHFEDRELPKRLMIDSDIFNDLSKSAETYNFSLDERPTASIGWFDPIDFVSSQILVNEKELLMELFKPTFSRTLGSWKPQSKALEYPLLRPANWLSDTPENLTLGEYTPVSLDVQCFDAVWIKNLRAPVTRHDILHAAKPQEVAEATRRPLLIVLPRPTNREPYVPPLASEYQLWVTNSNLASSPNIQQARSFDDPFDGFNKLEVGKLVAVTEVVADAENSVANRNSVTDEQPTTN